GDHGRPARAHAREGGVLPLAVRPHAGDRPRARVPCSGAALGGAAARRGQAGHPRGQARRRGDVPPPRGRGRQDGAQADARAQVLAPDDRGRLRPGLPAPAVPRLRRRAVDRLGGAALRVRRRRPPPPAAPSGPGGLHHPQQAARRQVAGHLRFAGEPDRGDRGEGGPRPRPAGPRRQRDHAAARPQARPGRRPCLGAPQGRPPGPRAAGPGRGRGGAAALVGGRERRDGVIGRAVDRYLSSTTARLVVVVLGAVGALLHLTVIPGLDRPPPYRIDLDVYRTGGQVFLDGGDLYGELPVLAEGAYLPFTYPPLSAQLFSVFTLVPLAVASTIITVATIAVTASVVRLVLTRTCDRPRRDLWWLTAAVVAVAIW